MIRGSVVVEGRVVPPTPPLSRPLSGVGVENGCKRVGDSRSVGVSEVDRGRDTGVTVRGNRGGRGVLSGEVGTSDCP